jgi:aromatic ring-opening dioxygenase catalytic subunit (LigB family)
MAELVGIVAASHGPLIARDWAKLPTKLQERFSKAYRALGSDLAAASPDILVVVATDHWTNFFLDNWPSVCIGVGAQHDGPPEPFLRDFPYRDLAGDADFGRHLFATAIESGFEPSLSHRLALDHGICIPLWRMDLAKLPRLVPILVNELEPPMPSLARCLAWGRLVAAAVRSYQKPVRVALLASGGLSHSIGEPGMGRINETFDRAAIAGFETASEPSLIATLESSLPQAGNGAEEVRSWLVAHGAAGGRGFRLVDYIPSREVYVGCAYAAWDAPGAPLSSATGAAAAAR